LITSETTPKNVEKGDEGGSDQSPGIKKIYFYNLKGRVNSSQTVGA